MILDKRLLGVLLNELYFAGKTELRVVFPLKNGVPLYDIKLGSKGVCNIRNINFDRYRREYGDLNYDKKVVNEIPTHLDYRDIFRSSGVLKPANYDEIVNELKKMERDPLTTRRPLYVGFDTNLLYDRFLNLLPAIKCGYCLCSGVKDELQPKWDVKIDKPWANQLTQGLGKIFDDVFLNQAPLYARKARLAAVEYLKISNRQPFKEAEGGRGDLNIVKGYEKEKNTKGETIDLVLLSADDGFVETAREHGIDAIHVQQETKLPASLETSWENVLDLIYVTAILFGVVKIDGVRVYGVGKGKKSEHWNTESLRVEIASEKISKELERDIKILGA